MQAFCRIQIICLVRTVVPCLLFDLQALARRVGFEKVVGLFFELKFQDQQIDAELRAMYDDDFACQTRANSQQFRFLGQISSQHSV